MPRIHINDWLWFAPNWGVILEEGAVNASPDDLHQAVATAFSHMRDRDLVNACCGAQGPLKDVGDLSIETYQQWLIAQHLIAAASQSTSE